MFSHDNPEDERFEKELRGLAGELKADPRFQEGLERRLGRADPRLPHLHQEAFSASGADSAGGDLITKTSAFARSSRGLRRLPGR